MKAKAILLAENSPGGGAGYDPGASSCMRKPADFNEFAGVIRQPGRY